MRISRGKNWLVGVGRVGPLGEPVRDQGHSQAACAINMVHALNPIIARHAQVADPLRVEDALWSYEP